MDQIYIILASVGIELTLNFHCSMSSYSGCVVSHPDFAFRDTHSEMVFARRLSIV